MRVMDHFFLSLSRYLEMVLSFFCTIAEVLWQLNGSFRSLVPCLQVWYHSADRHLCGPVSLLHRFLSQTLLILEGLLVGIETECPLLLELQILR